VKPGAAYRERPTAYKDIVSYRTNSGTRIAFRRITGAVDTMTSAGPNAKAMPGSFAEFEKLGHSVLEELEVEEVYLSIFTMFARSTISQNTKRTCCDYKGC
jgi:hypothetical protein